ncbi:murein transglycosylase A [Roseibium sp.]|uniref:murein transglycosylase A n=1 Tax=Roseibium sp. TaxID=1936156 RepID=UPI003A9733DB
MTSFADLPDWAREDHVAALSAFLRICRQPDILSRPGPYRMTSAQATALCSDAARVAEAGDPQTARRFFETRFTPVTVSSTAFLTGYFEPEFPASRQKTQRYSSALLRLPAGFTKVSSANRPSSWSHALPYGRRSGGKLLPLPDRGAVMDGAFDGEGLELAYLDPVDAFFVHVQGSARLRLENGEVMRVGFAGKTGHDYTSIARQLVLAGEGTPEDFTMSGLRQWLADHPKRIDGLLRQNRSYIFFREIEALSPDQGPIGALGLPLVPGRSLAVDPAHISYGLPLYLVGEIPGEKGRPTRISRIVIADDTGSAIKGAARGDLFVGSGDAAGQQAGDLHHPVSMTVLLPNGLASSAPEMGARGQ